jgi:putative colanic acid biosynthesis acetyltransferase WcaF
MDGDRVQRLEKFHLPEGFRGRSGIVVLVWQTVQATVFAWSPQPFYRWRNFLLRMFGAQIGAQVKVRPTARITYPWKVEIGDRAWIGDHVELYSLGPIRVGADAVLSQRSYICTGSHDFCDRTFPIYHRAIEIGHGAWIAADVFVAPGVRIGDGAVIGARSSVFHDVPAMTVAKGSPARPCGPRRMRDQADL